MEISSESWRAKSINNVFRNTLTLAFGAGAAKAVGLLAMPLITRLYSPSDFGLFAVFSSLVLLLFPLLTLRYCIVLPLPRSDRLAVNALALCAGLLLVSASLSVVLLLFFKEGLLRLLSAEGLLPYWWLVVPAAVLASAFETGGLWATRARKFGVVSKAGVWQAFAGASTKVALGLLSIKPAGLLIGMLGQYAVGSVVYLASFYREVRALAPQVNRRRMAFILRWHSQVPLYRLPSQFMFVIATQSPLIFASSLYGSEIAGQLGLALAGIALPMQLFGYTSGKAYYAEICRIGRQNADLIRKVSIDLIKKLSLLSVAPALLMILFGEDLFVIVFGAQWALAGRFAGALATYLLFQFVASPLMNALTLFNRQGTFLLLDSLRAISVVALFLAVGWLDLPHLQAIYAYSMLMSGVYLFSMLMVFRSISQERRR